LANNTVYYDSDGAGTFAQKAGAFIVPAADYKVVSVETAGNMLLATGSGIKKLDSLTGTFISAGVARGRTFDLRIINSTNWMSTGYNVSYRYLWSYIDANDNEIVGAPSERQDISNAAGADRAVELTIYPSAEVTASYYLKIFRSTQVTITPPEDFQLVYQAHPTAAEIAAGVIKVNDILPDDWRGESLYTNTTQEGIQKTNDRPPLAKFLTTYKDYTFYANIKNLHRLYTALISVTNLTAATSTIAISDGTNTLTAGCYILRQNCGTSIAGAADNGAGLIRITTLAAHGLTTDDYVQIQDVTGTTEANAKWRITVIDGTRFDLVGSAFVHAYVNGGTVDINSFGSIGNGVAGTANNGAGLIRITTTLRHNLTAGEYVKIYDITGTTEANGTWQVTPIAATTFDLIGSTYANAYVAGGGIDLYEDFGATPRFLLYNRGTDAQNIANTALSFIRTLNRCTANTWWDAFYNSNSSDPVGKIAIISRDLSAATFYLVVNSAATGGCFTPTIPTAGTTYESANDQWENGIMWSKQGQSEAVPIINIKRVKSADDPIIGVVGLRDSLFVIKRKDGLTKMTGDSESNFSWDTFDDTVTCLQRYSIAKSENSIFFFSDSGFVKVSDVGAELIGRDKEKDDLKPVDVAGFESAGYGWYYETQKCYKIATYKDEDSTACDLVQVYNPVTQAWTTEKHGDYTNDTAISMGIVINNHEFTAPLTGNGLLVERKDHALTDYSLPDIANTIADLDTTENIIYLNTLITIHDKGIVSQGGIDRMIIEYVATNAIKVNSVAGLKKNFTMAIANCANNGRNRIRVTTAVAHNLATFNGITIAAVTGTTEANGNWVVDVIDATNFDLYGSTYTNAYTGGGTITNTITIKPGIRSRLKYQQIHCSTPEYEKSFQAFGIYFDNDETSISGLDVYTYTDTTPDPIKTPVDFYTNDTWDGRWHGPWGERNLTDKVLIYPPKDNCRGTYTYLDIIHDIADERVDIAGYSLLYEITDSNYQKQ
jgi:hypothetical protein